MYAEELHAMFVYYFRTGFPVMPDQPNAARPDQSRWRERLTPEEEARMRDAIGDGVRNGPESVPWHRARLI